MLVFYVGPTYRASRGRDWSRFIGSYMLVFYAGHDYSAVDCMGFGSMADGTPARTAGSRSLLSRQMSWAALGSALAHRLTYIKLPAIPGREPAGVAL